MGLLYSRQVWLKNNIDGKMRYLFLTFMLFFCSCVNYNLSGDLPVNQVLNAIENSEKGTIITSEINVLFAKGQRLTIEQAIRYSSLLPDQAIRRPSKDYKWTLIYLDQERPQTSTVVAIATLQDKSEWIYGGKIFYKRTEKSEYLILPERTEGNTQP